MTETLAALLPAFVSLFVVIDPPGLLPVFMVLTAGSTRAYKRLMAWRTVVIAGCVLLIFAFLGKGILDLFGISLPAFQIAGGIMLFLIAAEMVFERRSEKRHQRATSIQAGRPQTGSPEEGEVDDIAVFPMAIPMIAGPGSISTVMLLTGEAAGDIPLQFGIAATLVLLLASCYVFFLCADRIGRFLSLGMAKAFSRILGIILAALAAQYILDGLRAYWGG